jgi:methylmalonyl-CoA/ethylmalonyl-CoA epimerase
MDLFNDNSIVQIGLIVKDVEKVARNYAEVFGIARPEIVSIADDTFANTIYRDRPTQAKGKAAFFKLGEFEIEPVGGPSTWQEFLQTHGEGIHHIAFRTNDMDQARNFLAAKGMKSVQQGGWDGGQYAYIDGSEQLGLILELLHFDR